MSVNTHISLPGICSCGKSDYKSTKRNATELNVGESGVSFVFVSISCLTDERQSGDHSSGDIMIKIETTATY